MKRQGEKKQTIKKNSDGWWGWGEGMGTKIKCVKDSKEGASPDCV